MAITGATGWIGLAMSHLCCDLGLSQDLGSLRLFGASERRILSCGRQFQIEKLDENAHLGEGNWLFIHLAFLGKERTDDMSPDEFETVNDEILRHSLKLAESAESLRFLFASSGAVYGEGRKLVKPPSNAYGLMKVRHEELIRGWAESRKTPLINARIFNIGGPLINKTGRYALSDFINQAVQSGEISIRADKPVFRSFVHVTELCKVLLCTLLEPSLLYLSFDTCGREIVEMSDLAAAIGTELGLTNFVVNRCQIATTQVRDWYVGDGAVYQSALLAMGVTPIGLGQIIRETAAFLSN